MLGPDAGISKWSVTGVQAWARPISGQLKVYGASEPTLTFTNDAGLLAGSFTGALARATGENVGSYAINLGTLTSEERRVGKVPRWRWTLAYSPKTVAFTPKAMQAV